MEAHTKSRPQVVLLDLGGVLVELSGVAEFGSMLGKSEVSEVWRTWLGSPAVRRFERGATDPDTFAQELVAELSLPIAPATFLERFATWARALYPGALTLIEQLRSQTTVACLSNTNDLHWQGPMRRFGLHGAFDQCFLSHQLGCLKPDRDVFDRVQQSLGVPAEAVLFLDDNQINVDAAREAGFDAHVAHGVTGAQAVLRRYALP